MRPVAPRPDDALHAARSEGEQLRTPCVAERGLGPPGFQVPCHQPPFQWGDDGVSAVNELRLWELSIPVRGELVPAQDAPGGEVDEECGAALAEPQPAAAVHEPRGALAELEHPLVQLGEERAAPGIPDGAHVLLRPWQVSPVALAAHPVDERVDTERALAVCRVCGVWVPAAWGERETRQ